MQERTGITQAMREFSQSFMRRSEWSWEDPSLSSQEKAYRFIKQAILEKKLRPGERLDESELAKVVGLSRTPVREALRLLSAEGLVKVVPHRGAYVVHLSQKDVQEIYQIREVLEGLAARLVAADLPIAALSALEEVLTHYTRAVQEEDEQSITYLDAQFHDIIARTSGNQRLFEEIQTYRGQLQLLRHRSVAIPGRPVRSLKEMRRILEAIRCRDPLAAEEAMRAHIRSVGVEMVRFMAEGT